MFGNAYNIFLLRQYFLTIPREMEEAAQIDGAGRIRTFVSVILPQAVPALTAVSLFHFFFAWNDFFGPLIYLAGNRDANPITVGLTEFNGLYSSETQLILAAAVISMILPLSIFFIAQRVFIQGIVVTGVDKKLRRPLDNCEFPSNCRSDMPETTHNDHRNSPDIAAAVERLLSQMTLEEKVGQMTMVENDSIKPDQVAEFFIGSILGGGGGNPEPNSPQRWREMVCGFQQAALQTRLGIPLIYGVDAVHGHNNVKGAVIFPHNIGLGAARDPELVERIGRITAKELLATSVHWTFAPTVSVSQDLRRGRTYEAYSEDSDVVAELGAALVRGLQGQYADDELSVLACAKHYVADGRDRTWRVERVDESMPQQGSTAPPQENAAAQLVDLSLGQWQIDQGDACIDETTLRAIHLPPYQAAIDAGALNVMASYSTWDGLKMHAHRYLLTDVLKGELGFTGLVVTDWMAINQIDPDYYICVTEAVNAGIDMVMVPYDFRRFVTTFLRAAKSGDVLPDRVDDAVRRILRVKFAFGLFKAPIGDASLLDQMGSEGHRQVAREALRKSLVLLKIVGDLLPLSKDLPKLIIAGKGADDIGLQCGGWSISWQGEAGATTSGRTILDGIRSVAGPSATIEYEPEGDFGDHPFRGKLPFSWPRSMNQVPLSMLRASEEVPLFQFGSGLQT